MLIFGTGSRLLLQLLVADKCGHCNTENSIHMYVFQKYFHIFWIPVFPTGQRIVSQCTFCKQVLASNQMPDSYTDAYYRAKEQAKTPWWSFIGLAVILLIMVVAMFR